MIENATFHDETVILQPGDRLYFYTDGVAEALVASEEEFRAPRLMNQIDRLRDRPLREGHGCTRSCALLHEPLEAAQPGIPNARL